MNIDMTTVVQLRCNSVSNSKQILSRCTYLLFQRIQKIHVKIRNNYLQGKKKKTEKNITPDYKTENYGQRSPESLFQCQDLAVKIICSCWDIFHRESKAISVFQFFETWQFSSYFLKETSTKQGKLYLVTEESSDLIFFFSPIFLVHFTDQGWSSITLSSITKFIPLSPGQVTGKEGFTLIRKGILLTL